MGQEINNNGPIEKQLNIDKVDNIYLTNKTRWQKRFEKLQQEVRNDVRYENFIQGFHEYNTIKDGIGVEEKLKAAGFNKRELIRALEFKEKYAKRVVKGEMFQAQQEIDVEIFSLIDNNFYTHVFPKIEDGCPKSEILKELMTKVVEPILDILNKEGELDEYLNYNANDIFGMVYFLTGKCHLNWKDYDTI